MKLLSIQENRPKCGRERASKLTSSDLVQKAIFLKVSGTVPRALSKGSLIRAINPGHWFAGERKVQGNLHSWAISAVEDLPSGRTLCKDRNTGHRCGFACLFIHLL